MARMQKTETVDLPTPRSLKEELEEAARSRHTSVADLLEQIVREWLERFRNGNGSENEEDDEEQQRRLRAEVMKFTGTIEGEPDWSESVRPRVRAKLAQKYGR
ncbi:MAG TPA: ribbon-helix-helix protein, CopG family [Thermoanaerobaculia bacterium]|nr:ribbon-helix-helix protein, CopG family [Thermoanaerobaculia bacterium]